MVPPFDSTCAPRRVGVRLRDHIPPLTHLTPFDVLYTPEQLRADAVDMERSKNGLQPVHAPGWVRRPEEEDALVDRAARAAALRARAASNAPVTLVDVAAELNPSGPNEHRREREFTPLLSPLGGPPTFTVRHLFGARAARRTAARRSTGVEASSTSDDAAVGMAALQPHHPSLLQYSQQQSSAGEWLISADPHALAPVSSTTHSTFCAQQQESARIDTELFHSYFDDGAPADSCPPDSADPHRALHHLRLKRVPNVSNENPSLFIRMPARAAFPQLWRNSRVLRDEQIEKQRQRHRRLQSTGVALAPLTAAQPPPRTPRTARETDTRSYHAGVRMPSPPSSSSAVSGAHSARSSSSHPDVQSSSPSLFAQHMQRARQRWKEMGIVVTHT
jgi:hypothetical protein